MKIIVQSFMAFALILFYSTTFAQSTDTTVFITVQGECGMCKERIEDAAKLRGVSLANWDEATKQLKVVYNTKRTSQQKIEKAIAAVGHDTQNEKAEHEVYDKLPGCCLYRSAHDKDHLEHGQGAAEQIADSILSEQIASDVEVKGVVLQTDKTGNFTPLQSASVHWLGTSNGVFTDSLGTFSLHPSGKSNQLVVSYQGYVPDTIVVGNIATLRIILADKQSKHLSEVKVSSSRKSTYINALDPIRTQVMTQKELVKAACCNLSESFETNPSVDVSFNDAVTGSKQIQLLGLNGNYTQLSVENMPGPRGIATSLGLNFIPGPWIESIQLIKGTGSVVNGFESIAGQINVEMKQPQTTDRLYFNAYTNSQLKTDFNLNLAQKINKNWSVGLLLHDDFLHNVMDDNKDGFRDQPTGNQFNLVNRWHYNDVSGVEFQLGFRYLTDDKVGGENSFQKSQKLSNSIYGIGIKTNRKEVFSKLGYVFPNKKYKSVGLQLSYIDHLQNSFFGVRNYDAAQKNFYANLIYQSIIGTTFHKFRAGLNFNGDQYNELYLTNSFVRKENVFGGFFEYTYNPDPKFTAVAGLRGDYNNLYGFFATPRVNIRYEPFEGTTLRLSTGRGQRTANIFAENMAALVSARDVNIISPTSANAYGLQPEVSWNKGITIDQKFNLFNKKMSIALDYFRNDFENQVVADLEDPRKLDFYNLKGKSFSNSLQAELTLEPVKSLETKVSYRLFDVKTTYGTQLLQRPFISKNRAFVNLAYSYKKWKLDYTVSYNGTKRIPSTTANPQQFRLAETSPSYIQMNSQVSVTVGKKYPLDLYVGGENLTNYHQKNLILASQDPFGNLFDASMVWGPVSGRMIYAGLRFKIK